MRNEGCQSLGSGGKDLFNIVVSSIEKCEGYCICYFLAIVLYLVRVIFGSFDGF